MKKNPLLRKCLAVGIILLFVGTCIIPAIAQDTGKPLPTSRGNWLYVGGSGLGNYTKIQDAINDAVSGDTVFVYDDSSPYKEAITVNKAIMVQGENWETTFLQGGLGIITNNVTINGFTVSNGGVRIYDSSNNIVENCYIMGNGQGLLLRGKSGNNCIRNCSFRFNELNNVWIKDTFREKNEISYCDFSYRGCGYLYSFPSSIFLWRSQGTKIHHCNFTNNWRGILLLRSTAQITSNNFVNSNKEEGAIAFHLSPGFSDVRYNWWGTPQGPNISIRTFSGLVTIRKADNSDNVIFFGLLIQKIIKILGLLPWLTEPVADAGRHT